MGLDAAVRNGQRLLCALDPARLKRDYLRLCIVLEASENGKQV